MGKVLKGKDFPNGDFLHANLNFSPLFFFMECSLGRDLLHLGLCWLTNEGNYMNIFKNPWIPKFKLFRPISPMLSNSSYKVSELLLVNGYWNVVLIS